MEVLAYLLVDRASNLLDSELPHAQTRILFGSRKTNQGDVELLQVFSHILLHLDKEQTFDTLHKRLPFHWHDDEPYDTVNPFGDSRQSQYHSLWTFDTRNDVLRHTNCSYRAQISLSLMRNRKVSMADMEITGGPIPKPLAVVTNLTMENQSWKPSFQTDERLRAYIHRLVRDFNHQWRHVLRAEFNYTTLRVFASAAIRLSTLDFTIKENTGGRGPRGVHVWITQLPSWEPLEAKIQRAGDIYIVLCQDIKDGLSQAKQHLLSHGSSPVGNLEFIDEVDSRADYMILSVRHIMLCRANSPISLISTAAEPLFNGNYNSDGLSELAMDYLIWATTSIRPSVITPLRSLPIEVQSIVLNYTSIGTVQAAKFGCLLGMGGPFSWKEGLLTLKLEERHVVRPSGSSVESQVWFDDHKSGIVYLARPSW